MRLPAVLTLLLPWVLFAPAAAQFGACGAGGGMCTCPDGVTVAASPGLCPGGGASITMPPPLPRCSAGSVAAGPCVCSDGRLSGVGGTCAEHACPAGQIRVGDNCRCVERGFAADPVSGVCGCPAGTVMTAGKGGPTCAKG